MPKSKKLQINAYYCPLCKENIQIGDMITYGENTFHSNCPNVKTEVVKQPQKYQCWKCEGKGKEIIPLDLESRLYFKVDVRLEICSNCNGKGYIELIPYKS